MAFSAELLQDVKRTADLCVKCNVCTTACPVLPQTPLFPGPKYVGPQAQRFRDPDLPSPDKSLDYCSGCGVCTLVCPHSVRVMEINTVAKAALRARQVRQRPFDLHLLRNWILGRNELLGKLGSPVAPLANAVFNFRPARLLMEKIAGVDHRAPFPRFSFTSFRRWFKHSHQSPVSYNGQALRQVAYFHGCATNYYEPAVGKAIVAVLEHNGFQVVLPEQNCCGLPMQSNGDFKGARANAEANIRNLLPYARQGIPIVVGGSSCGQELKSDYREILGMHSDEARLIAEHVYDISEFLWLEYQAGHLKTDFLPQALYLPVHSACHQKLQRIGRPALDLLNLIPGLKAEEMVADCCGIGGTYGYKHEKYEIAQAVGKPLFERVKATGAAVAVCDNETCRWNLAASTGLKVVHTMQVLAQAYGIPEFERAAIRG